MMKFHSALTGGLAAFLVLPLFAQDQTLRTLENALLGTNRAIDSLQKIQERITQDPLAGIDLILSATEAPQLEERERDARLEALRNEVNALQMRYDSMRLNSDPNGAHIPDDRVPTTGMSPELRDLLAGPEGKSHTPKPRTPKHDAKVLPDGPNYSADPVAQARAYYRLGRYSDGLTTLQNAGNNPIGLYWKARCLEKLGRVEEAIKELERVVELAPESHEGKRAKTDIEFLTWKNGFKKKLPKSGGEE